MHIDRNGNTRKYDYDVRGNLVTAVDPMSGTASIESCPPEKL